VTENDEVKNSVFAIRIDASDGWTNHLLRAWHS
jgi:hypothetical protein